MMKKTIMTAAAILLCSCSMYKNFETPQTDVSQLYRDTVSANYPAADTLNMGDIPWEEMFSDTTLQHLIKIGLENNMDVQVALLRIEQAEAALSSARLAYTPSLNLTPNGAIANFDDHTSKTYTLPVAASWQINLFGGLHNSRQSAKAALAGSQAMHQAVKSRLIASVATRYYSLLMLDRQKTIMEETLVIWQKSIETMRSMKSLGMINEAAISQSEANCFAVAADLQDVQRQIRELENGLSVFLGQPVQGIPRMAGSYIVLPDRISVGVPLQMLSHRPDVKQAEMALAATYYGVNVARSAFYPNLTIDALAGWTNNAGSLIFDPGKLILSAAGSLFVPLLNKGQNRARLRIAKSQYEEASIAFKQTLLAAGSEVSDALYQFHTSQRKHEQRLLQIESLQNSVEYTQELFRLGSSTYLEILTAQQGLLGAQISDTYDRFEQIQAAILLYQALGGGR